MYLIVLIVDIKKKSEPRNVLVPRNLGIQRLKQLIRHVEGCIRVEKRTRQLPDFCKIRKWKKEIACYKKRLEECKNKKKCEKCAFTRTEFGCGPPSCKEVERDSYSLFFEQRCT